MELSFTYNSKSGRLLVVRYEKHRKLVGIKHEGIYYEIALDDFLKCNLETIKPLRFKYFKGDIIKTVLQSFLIEGSREADDRIYSCKCDACGVVSELTEAQLDNRHTCHYCRGFKMLEGESDLAITHPEIAVLLKNPDDYRTLDKNSDTHTDWLCGTCGLDVLNKQVKTVVKHGLSCIYCSDSYSFGEKFTFATLRQAGLDVCYEYRPSWSMGKRYDFFVATENMIVEVHGMHHYADVYEPNAHEVVTITDTLKREMAKEVGIEHYVELDCRKSDHEWLRNSIENSELARYLTADVDFHQSLRFALGMKGEWVCHLWESGKSLAEIETITGLNRNNIRNKLIRGTNIGLCDYNAREGIQRGREALKRPIVLLNTGEVIGGLSVTARTFNLNPNALANACKVGRYLGYDQQTGECYQWGYQADYLCGAYNIKQVFHKESREVVCTTTGALFTNVKDASQYYGIHNYLHIIDACEGKRRYAGKCSVTKIPLSWLYLEEFEASLRDFEDNQGGLFDDEA